MIRQNNGANGAEALAAIATGRATSMFAADLLARRAEIADAVGGARILAIGAAGSIGSSTASVLAQFAPRALHVVDQNENELAEFVRRYWSGPDAGRVGDFQTLPLDYGSFAFKHFLHQDLPYDIILNFAAIKHVRSEKDVYSLMQMFDTNIVKQIRALRWMNDTSPKARLFSVSTDKAANPVSFMGATKRLMEHVIFDAGLSGGSKRVVNTARFANVAFSNGSLLQSFESRLARGEPLACPKAVKRYFVSLEESGHICALAALLAPDRTIAVPDLDPQTCLVDLEHVARRYLAFRGYDAVPFDDAEAAKSRLADARSRGQWPLVLTPADTAGEKPYEEFISKGEQAQPFGLEALLCVPWIGPGGDGDLTACVEALERLVSGSGSFPDRDDFKRIVGAVEPAFLANHKTSSKSLDQRA